MKENNNMNKGKKIHIIINISAIIILAAIFSYLFIKHYDDIKLLSTEIGREKLIEKIQNTGLFGGIIIILIQILQVVVAFIPGEFVEIISGALFGPIGGLIYCLIGLNLGTLVIYGLVKLLGKPFVHENIKEQQDQYKLINDSSRQLVIVFFLFLMPGIPKDILLYPLALTKNKIHKVLIVTSIARIPSILTSTITGSSLLNENYTIAIISFVISLILALVGLMFNKQITNLITKKINEKK